MNENGEVEVGEEEGVLVDEKGNVEDASAKATKAEEVSLEERNEENEELSEVDSEEEREAIRARRREERKNKKRRGQEREQAKDRLVASLQMQVQDLATRLAQVDKRQSGTDFAKLEEELNQAIQIANEAKEHLKNASKESDGEGVAEATELYYTARRRAEFLAGVKQKVVKGSEQASYQLDSRIVNNASTWMKKNSWYKHGGADTDSVVAKAVDDQLVRDGYDPRTNEYWDELNDRLAEKLPHRFKRSAPENRRSSPPVSGSDKDGPTGGVKTPGKFLLSAARVQALKDSGVWDDVEARNKMIKRYQQYDAEKGKN